MHGSQIRLDSILKRRQTPLTDEGELSHSVEIKIKTYFVMVIIIPIIIIIIITTLMLLFHGPTVWLVCLIITVNNLGFATVKLMQVRVVCF